MLHATSILNISIIKNWIAGKGIGIAYNCRDKVELKN